MTKQVILNIFIFVSLFCLIFLLRWPVFHWSVVDWDESLFLLVGRGWLHGEIPYTSIWEIKPPGIFGLFALSQWFLGEQTESIRIAADLAIGCSSFILYLFGIRMFRNRWHALFPAMMYVLFSMANGGLESTIEIFYTPLVILSFYLLDVYVIDPRRGYVFKIHVFCIGVLLSLSLQLKYLMIFECLVITIVMLYYSNFGIRMLNWKNVGVNSLVFLIGVSSSFMIATAYFVLHDAWGDYFQAAFISVFYYAGERSFSEGALLDAFGKLLFSNLFLWSLVALAFAGRYLFDRLDWVSNGKFPLLFSWMAAAFTGALLTRRFYPHYFLPLLPPMCLIASYTIIQAFRNLIGQLKFKWLGALGIAVLLAAGIQFYIYLHKPSSKKLFGDTVAATDVPRMIAKKVNAEIDPSEYIYVANYQPVLYYLVNARIPTKFAFTQHLSNDPPSIFLPVDPIEELERIMTLKPKFVVVANHSSTPFFEKLEAHIANDYVLWLDVDSDWEADKTHKLRTIQVFKLLDRVRN